MTRNRGRSDQAQGLRQNHILSLQTGIDIGKLRNVKRRQVFRVVYGGAQVARREVINHSKGVGYFGPNDSAPPPPRTRPAQLDAAESLVNRA